MKVITHMLCYPSDSSCIETARPKGFISIPYERDESFTGRENVLQIIDQMLSSPKALCRIALVGLGGVGYVIALPFSTIRLV